MAKKKACLNPSCSNCKRTKYKESEQICPICHGKLDFVCTNKGCYKVISEKLKEKFCPICKAEKEDTKAKVIDVSKKALGVAGTIATLVIPFVIKGKSEKN